MASEPAEFIEAYNAELAQLNCRLRVRSPEPIWHRGSLEVYDGDEAFGVIPDTIEPLELSALVRLIDRAFAAGIALGRDRTAENNTK